MTAFHTEALTLSRSATEVTDLGELLRHWAELRPSHLAFTYLGDDEVQEQRTYGQLHQRATQIAGYLQHELAAGDRALLLFPAGLEFIEAFFGCLYAGVIPVPTCYPKPNRPMPRLSSIARDTDAAVVLSTEDTLGQMNDGSNSGEAWTELPRIATDAIAPIWNYHWDRPNVSTDDVAFLQYTSGSTSDPKGVMVSHGNLLANLEAIQRGFRVQKDETGAANSRGVFWLPAYHDMGLIGGILSPLYMGGQSFLMSPRAFLQRPLRWLEWISRTQANISGAPNFAFDLCVDKTTPQQRAALDLSSWEVAFCGAEPIRAETLERFAEAFAVSGFRRDAFYPCYGLAESTLLVAGGDGPAAPVVRDLPRSGDVQTATQQLVGCGESAHLQQVEIVDPESLTLCEPGQVGEIWVRGPSNALGYWNRPEDTEQTFAAHLADTGEGPFLRTGDLGFTAGGQLYITGRMKDMIIVRGRNYYPQDIEWTTGEAHVALQPNGGASFGVEIEGGESVVVVHEVARTHRDADLTQVVRAIRRELVQQQEVDPWAIVLLRPGNLPRTTSGKVQRSLCRQQYFGGQLKVLEEWTNPTQRPAHGGRRNRQQPSKFDWQQTGGHFAGRRRDPRGRANRSLADGVAGRAGRRAA